MSSSSQSDGMSAPSRRYSNARPSGDTSRTRTPPPPGAQGRSGRYENQPSNVYNAGGDGGGGQRRSRRPRRPRSRDGRGYNYPDEKRRSHGRSNEVRLELCVWRQGTHRWKITELNFNRNRINDQELWEDIRKIYRTELQPFWMRILFFRILKHIVPIEYSASGVPKKTSQKDAANNPDSHEFMHAYHHPDQIRTRHEWVDWFYNFDAQSPDIVNGLEFVEGLWANKLALIAVAASIAIVVVSIVWCVKGGNLQTVFTVMGFVLTFVSALIALAALYYQIASPSSDSDDD